MEYFIYAGEAKQTLISSEGGGLCTRKQYSTVHVYERERRKEMIREELDMGQTRGCGESR